MLAVAVRHVADEGGGDDERADDADGADGIVEDAFVGPLLEGLFLGFGEAEVDLGAEELGDAGVAVVGEELLGADQAERIFEVAGHEVLAAFAAGEGEVGDAGAKAARVEGEHAAVLVVGMGDDVEDGGAGVELAQELQTQIPRVFLAPAIAGLGVALLVIYLFPRVRGSGVNQTKAAMYISNGYIPFSTVIGKFVTCALAIGSGQSLGPEDPSLQMGAGIASAIGRSLKLSQARVRLIAPVGAAAGLAAAFNAPISAVLFVIEEVIGTWSAGVLGAIVLAAVSSVVTMRWFLGANALFRVPALQIVRPVEYLAYAILGVVGGLVSLLFIKWIEYARPRILALPGWTQYILPAGAGLVIGIVGIWLPQVMGAGYGFIDQAMHDQFTWQILALLAMVKILSTSLSFVSGTPGGMFAPTLFIGAMLGGAVGAVEHHFFPWLSGGCGHFRAGGMGTCLPDSFAFPLTSVFMVLEVSGNYSIILPVMISNPSPT